MFDIAHSYRVMIKNHADMSIEPALLSNVLHLMTARCHDAKMAGSLKFCLRIIPTQFYYFLYKLRLTPINEICNVSF